MVLAEVRARRPLIHYLPNLVTANDVANSLLAVGASPIMAVAPEEVGDIQSDALALNLGTVTIDRVAVLELAGRAAVTRGRPVVLDPVGAGATPFRRASARRLLSGLPITILRLNAGEAAALLSIDTASSSTVAARGVDAADPATDTAELARALARCYHCVAAVTGQTDAVSDGQRVALIDNGHPLMARITGAGDMATGVVAACAAVESDALRAAAAALLAFGVAGAIAARSARGPGSLRPELLDALASLDTTTLIHEGRIRWS
jgi:hydroxyethylthiazole kinase